MWAIFKKIFSIGVTCLIFSYTLLSITSAYGQRGYQGGNPVIENIDSIPVSAKIIDFKPEQIVNEEIERTFTPISGENWRFYLLITLAVLIAYIKFAYPKELSALFLSLGSINLANQLYREQENSLPFSYFLLTLNFLISAGIFFYLLIISFGYNFSLLAIKAAIIVTVVFAGLYLIRYISFKLLASVFSFGHNLNLYLFHLGAISKMTGIALYPILFLALLAKGIMQDYAIWTGIGVISISMIFIYLRGLAIARHYIILHRFHFFLYICTLEIAPILIVIKVIKVIWVN